MKIDTIKRGRELVYDAIRLDELVESGFPQSRNLARQLHLVAIKSEDVQTCVLAFVQAKDALTPSERRGLQILLTHEKYSQVTGSN